MNCSRKRLISIPTLSLVFLILSPPESADAAHYFDWSTTNLHPLGHIEEPASLLTGAGGGNIHTDIAFWGKHAFQGSWLGFNIRDISDPDNPTQVSFTSCNGNQGDIVVWDNILIRTWNSPASLGATCDGQSVPIGFEGLHIFDISDLADPVLVGSVDLSSAAIFGRCGSHTATGVPDLDNDRLLIYNSGGGCDGIDIIEVPLDNPGAAIWIGHAAAGRNCHDTAVILGDAMLASCAGGDGLTTWSIGGMLGGTLVNPNFLWSATISGVTVGHAVGFTWDGEVLVFDHEPGGGVQANCQASNPDSDKSVFFLDAQTAEVLGTWTLPRPQSDIENCTIHNFNVVPVRSGNYILVSGNYQSGTSIVDFTDPASPVEIAYSDPPAIEPVDLGGAWSSYWYNNFIYESNIPEGLNVFRFSGRETAGALRLDHLNPQTQEFTLP